MDDRKVRDCELPSKEYRGPDDAYIALNTCAREPQRLRSEYGHFMSTPEFPGERGHHHSATTAEWRVLIVEKQDLQAAKLFRGSRLSALPRVM